MPALASGRLAAVLANPPLTDGSRTLCRVSLAAELLGFTHVEIVNLFGKASHATRDIDVLGTTGTWWLAARPRLEEELAMADAVLLAYGVAAPCGPARTHHREQVDWLRARLTAFALPIWWVGNAPRHPSRWQRWTHREYADAPFAVALRDALTLTHPDAVTVAH